MLWNPVNYYIGPAEGSSGNVHLLDLAAVLVGGEGSGPYWRFTDTGIEFDAVVTGTTTANAQANVTAISVMLQRASRARGAYGLGTAIVLSMQLADASWRYLDVTGGMISPVRDYVGGRNALVTLTLDTLPYARGDAVTMAATGTLTNGTGSTWLVENIPGDVPALARLTISDVSTGSAVINGVHVYQRSLHGLTAGHFDPVIEMVAATPGVATTDASSYSSTNFARLGANSTWQTIAEVTRPTGDYNNGLYDVWLRLRDSSAVPDIPRELEATVTTGVTITARGSATGNSTTIAVATTAELTADDFLVLVVRGRSRTVTISSITSVGGASWTLATDGTNDARVVHGIEAAQVNVYWLRPASTIAVGTTITVTFSATMEANVRLLQLTGLATASPTDDVAPDATVTNSVSITTGSVTTTQAVAMLIAVVADNSNSNYGGFTDSFSGMGQGSGYSIGYRLVTAVGTYSTAATAGTSTNDHVGTLVAFKALATTASTLTVGTWNLRVVAVGSNGLLSAVTDVVQVPVANTTDSIQLNWTAPAGSTPSSYRVYRDRGTGWGYFDTGSTATAYTWTTETGITTNDPDLDGDARGLFRVQVALANGVTLFTGPSFSGVLGNSMWEDVLSGTVPLPPIPALDATTPPVWLLRVQGKHADVSPDLDVDIAWLMPHESPQAIAQYTGLALATKRDHVIDQRRDGRISGRLYNTGTSTDAGQLDTIGQLTVGPGATQLAVRCTVAGGASDVDDAKFTAVLRYVPRWRAIGRGL